MSAILTWIPLMMRRRKREALLREAAHWPSTQAKLLKSTVVPKDPLAEAGTTFQESQVESAFYFTLNGAYYGGHLRSTPVSDSEGHRLLKALPEDLPIQIRYDPTNPDRTIALPEDNANFPTTIWPT